MSKTYALRSATLGALLLSQAASADFVELLGTFSSELEEQAAVAALDTYNRLLAAGCDDNFLIDPILDPDRQGTSACTGRTYRIFSNVREIIHTGNELTGTGPSLFSLGSSPQGLGFALRWLAAEEYAAQGDMSGDFVGGQMGSLSTRLSALRFGARGFQFAANGNGDGRYAGQYGTRGGAAGDDLGYSRLGGFLNVQMGEGSRDPTGLEDAFDIDSTAISAGLDYRLDDRWVVGGVFGYSEQTIDFDSAQSIVDGGIESQGYSLMPFFMFQDGNYYISGSLGLQQLSFDSLRSIRYPSFNPDLPSTNTDTVSSTDASILTLFAETGYSFVWKAFTLEPYLNLNASSFTIDEFVEDDLNDQGFDLVIEEQSFDALDISLGVKMQYTLTLGRFVAVPYVSLEQIAVLEDAPRTVGAYYAGLPFEESTFQIETEAQDGSYNTFNFGISSVLRGGRQKSVGGTVAGDVQAFFNIKSISGLEGYDLSYYSFGLRVAF